ncbi:ribokinase [Microbacterium sp. BR1]|uniref:ribokinase n=1 Tax=Microbacterium sp. BR1 TaxID=1070896 RepID=UPI000C2C501B|nr:ribokinase [Microbacterium sp. BR1]
MTVIVLGSANADLTVDVPYRPRGGETLLGSDLSVSPGGKGANQAAAASCAGATTRFLGCVGDDGHGVFLREQLAATGVETTALRISSDRATGTAMILLTPDGENSIVVSPGANHQIVPAMVEGWADILEPAGVLVLSLEIPLDSVTAAIEKASGGARILLNAAPAQELDRVILSHCDPLIVNEHEARMILGADDNEGFEKCARALREAGARSVVITLGAQGAVVCDEGGTEHIPAHTVPVVDTTGAGDAFVGACAAELSRDVALRDAVRFATAMSALSVQSRGAQTSYPCRAAVEELLARTAEEQAQ